MRRTGLELVPVEPVVAQGCIVDLNGAGDAFAGGFLAGVLAGRGLRECARVGQHCAAEVVQCEGCSFPEACRYDWDALS